MPQALDSLDSPEQSHVQESTITCQVAKMWRMWRSSNQTVFDETVFLDLHSRNLLEDEHSKLQKRPWGMRTTCSWCLLSGI